MKMLPGNQFKTLAVVIFVVSTFRVLFPFRRLEYYYLKLRRYYYETKNKKKSTLEFWFEFKMDK
jgi:hypothetical protein